MVSERSVVNVSIEKVDLVTGRCCIGDSTIRAMLLLAFPMQVVLAQEVVILGEALLLLASNKENDLVRASRRNDAARNRLDASVAPERRELGA